MESYASELPETLIHRIQSLLPSKQAAQTTLLSKSWHSAFSTRPNLDFDQLDFSPRGQIVPYASNTIDRYASSNRKIRSFLLRVRCRWRSEYSSLIRRALEIGATRLSLHFQYWGFVLPKEVFFVETLETLTLKRAKIYEPNLEVRWSGLESLCLEDVVIETSDLFSGIVSTCPMLRELSLSRINYEQDSFNWDIDVIPRAIANIRRLRSLVLVNTHFETYFLDDLSNNFPELKDLTLHRHEGNLVIASRSLERLEIKLEKEKDWPDSMMVSSRIQFDLIPNIREFTFEGPGVPLVYFKSDLSSTTPNRLMNGLSDRKEVSAQIFDKGVSTWRDVPLELLAETRPRGENIRLKWRLGNGAQL